MNKKLRYNVFNNEDFHEEASDLTEEALVKLFNDNATEMNTKFGLEGEDFIKPVATAEEVRDRKDEMGWIVDVIYELNLYEDPLVFRLLERAGKFNETWGGFALQKEDFVPPIKYEIKPLIVTGRQVYLQVLKYPVDQRSEAVVRHVNTTLNFFKNKDLDYVIRVILKRTLNIEPKTFVM